MYDNDYRHPIVLAKELATMDVLSEGRIQIGLGGVALLALAGGAAASWALYSNLTSRWAADRDAGAVVVFLVAAAVVLVAVSAAAL